MHTHCLYLGTVSEASLGWISKCQTFCSLSKEMSWAIIALLSQMNPCCSQTIQNSRLRVGHFLPIWWAHSLCSEGQRTAPSSFSPNAITGNIKCTEALCMVNTKAVAVFVMGVISEMYQVPPGLEFSFKIRGTVPKYFPNFNRKSASFAFSYNWGSNWLHAQLCLGTAESQRNVVLCSTECINYKFVIIYIYLFPIW